MQCLRRLEFIERLKIGFGAGPADSDLRRIGIFADGFVVEDFADLGGESFHGEGLLEEGDFTFDDAVAHDRIVGIAGDEENFDARETFFELDGEFAAAGLRHDDVADEKIDARFVGFGDANGVGTVAGFEDGVAIGQKKIANLGANALFVIDEKNSF